MLYGFLYLTFSQYTTMNIVCPKILLIFWTLPSSIVAQFFSGVCPNGVAPRTSCNHLYTSCASGEDCVNAMCCPKVDSWQFACGGDSAISASYTDGHCGGGYYPNNGYCCACPNGVKSSGRCNSPNSNTCPGGSTCHRQTWSCCPTNVVIPNVRKTLSPICVGPCVRGLCPTMFTCIGSDVLRQLPGRCCTVARARNQLLNYDYYKYKTFN